jgi:microcystin-dependent protein
VTIAQFDTVECQVLHVRGDADANRFLPRTSTAVTPGTTNVPIGGMILSPGTLAAPWLLCNGSTFSGATYPALQTFLGGTTLPDMRNLSPMGAGATVALGSTAGALTNPLTTAQLAAHTHGSGGGHVHTGPAHTHTVSDVQNSNLTAGASGVNVPGGATQTGSSGTGNTGNTDPGPTASTGSGNSFSILSPVIGVNWYIRAA